MIKPDGVARDLKKEIFFRLEQAGLKVESSLKVNVTKEMAADLYQPHLGKNFYPGLLNFITSGPVIACVVSGENAIRRTRELMGATDPLAAAQGTIRGDLREEVVTNKDGIIKNIVHGSDSAESAAREIPIFFNK